MASPVIASNNSLVVIACFYLTSKMINIAMNSYLVSLCLLNNINGNPYIVIQHSCIAASVEKQGCRLPNYRLPNGRLLNGRDCQTARLPKLPNGRNCWTSDYSTAKLAGLSIAQIPPCLPTLIVVCQAIAESIAYGSHPESIALSLSVRNLCVHERGLFLPLLSIQYLPDLPPMSQTKTGTGSRLGRFLLVVLLNIARDIFMPRSAFTSSSSCPRIRRLFQVR